MSDCGVCLCVCVWPLWRAFQNFGRSVERCFFVVVLALAELFVFWRFYYVGLAPVIWHVCVRTLQLHSFLKDKQIEA